MSQLGSPLGHLFNHAVQFWSPLPLLTGPVLQPLHKLAALEQLSSTRSGAAAHALNPHVAHNSSASAFAECFDKVPNSVKVPQNSTYILHPNIPAGPHHIM